MHRYPELDLLRTLAFGMMVTYHTAYDLAVYYRWNIPVFDGGWWLLARSTAILFLLVSGASMAVSLSRSEHLPNAVRWKKHLRRCVQIGGAAMLVSVVTYSVDPQTYVRFGILHMIAVGSVLLALLHSTGKTHAWVRHAALLQGLAVIAIGLWTSTLQSSAWWLLALGIRPADFRSVDYFPLIPWFGVMLIGYGFGYLIYIRFPHMHPVFNLKADSSQLTAVTYPSRHALLCYLAHQPMILLVLWLILGKPDM